MLGDLDRATQRFGLATTAGNVSHTGVGGLTLGGGMGWLARRFGLACDNVARFELVSAEEGLVSASDQQRPELFWGLGGGGGNFGVVTEFEFTLHQVGAAALLVDLVYEPEEAPGALRRWRELLSEAPREVTLTAWVGTTGPWSLLPPALWGRPLASVGYVWVGDPDQGQRLLAALRDGTPPVVAERVQELSYLELQTMDDQTHRHGCCGATARATSCASSTTRRSRPSWAAAATATATAIPRCWRQGSLQSYGGAIAEVADDETAFGHRDALVELVAVAAWTDPTQDQTRMAAARRYGRGGRAVRQRHLRQRPHRRGPAGIRRAYGPGTLARLAALKGRYDPGNLFHLNHNLRPRNQPPR